MYDFYSCSMSYKMYLLNSWQQLCWRQWDDITEILTKNWIGLIFQFEQLENLIYGAKLMFCWWILIPRFQFLFNFCINCLKFLLWKLSVSSVFVDIRYAWIISWTNISNKNFFDLPCSRVRPRIFLICVRLLICRGRVQANSNLLTIRTPSILFPPFQLICC